MPRGARPGRQLDGPPVLRFQAAIRAGPGLPPVAMAGSHRWPVVMTACRWRSSAAASAACAWPAVSLLCSRLVRWAKPGGVDGVGFQCAPDRAPGCQAQRRAALPGGAGPAGVAAGALLPRREAGVLDQRPAGGEPSGVAGLGQDRGGADRGQAGDRGDQAGQSELVQDGDHPLLGVGEAGLGVAPVGQQQRRRAPARRGAAR